MTEDERARVGRALDHLRDSLLPYVDAAMIAAYGDSWTEMVSDEETKRRNSGRKWVVKKNDLATLLQAMIYRRIDPWQKLDQYPRIRGFVSEVQVLRNLYAHGDACTNEYERLIDTTSRLLVALGLPVPSSLVPQNLAATTDRTDRVDERRQLPFELPAAEWARLSATGRRLLEVTNGGDRPTEAELVDLLTETHRLEVARDNTQAIETALALVIRGSLWLEFKVHDYEMSLKTKRYDLKTKLLEELMVQRETIDLQLQQEPDERLMQEIRGRARQSIHEIKLHALDEARLQGPDEEIRQRIDLLRKQLIDEYEEGQRAVEGATTDHQHTERPSIQVLEDELAEIDARIDELSRVRPIDSGAERWGEVIRLAAELRDGDRLTNWLTMIGAWGLFDEAKKSGHAGWRQEARPHLTDAIASARILAGTNPGSDDERTLILLLRQEGELCNDLELPDEAIQAFARADEITDRYPLADPAFSEY